MWQRYGDYRARKKMSETRSVYEDVQQTLRSEVPIATRRWKRQPDLSYLKPLIAAARAEANALEEEMALSGARAWHWLRVLALQAPQAALAQVQMDKHHHGFAARGARLEELIDFNDAFVSTVLALDGALLPDFAARAKALIDWFCKRVGVKNFSAEQYEAIVQGLGREIAVYHGAHTEGFAASMASRASDALGVDMVITDSASGRRVNIDCKAPSSFRHRIYELLREGRLSGEEVTAAEALGFIAEMNGHGHDKTEVVVWRIDSERYGEIVAFRFLNTTALGIAIRSILETYGVRD